MIRMVGRPHHLPTQWKERIEEANEEHFQFILRNCIHAHWWWVSLDGDNLAGFAGAVNVDDGLLFLGPCGVLPEYRGRGIQNDFIRARFRFAKRMGFVACVTRVEPGNIASANNFIDERFRFTEPWKKGGTMPLMYLFRRDTGVAEHSRQKVA